MGIIIHLHKQILYCTVTIMCVMYILLMHVASADLLLYDDVLALPVLQQTEVLQCTDEVFWSHSSLLTHIYNNKQSIDTMYNDDIVYNVLWTLCTMYTDPVYNVYWHKTDNSVTTSIMYTDTVLFLLTVIRVFQSIIISNNNDTEMYQLATNMAFLQVYCIHNSNEHKLTLDKILLS